jgi:hypothetical protein
MTRSLQKKVVIACVFLGLGSVTALAQDGPKATGSGVVEAFDKAIWNYSGEGLVTVVGDGSTDLDCFAFDAVSGDLVGEDTEPGDFCFLPGYSRSGRIRVEIRNLGSVKNAFVIGIA